MKATAKVGRVEAPVKITHWWPGKKKEPGIPGRYIEAAKERGSVYLVYALASFGRLRFYALAFCEPCDHPDPEIGRTIVIKRLGRLLKKYNGALVVT